MAKKKKDYTKIQKMKAAALRTLVWGATVITVAVLVSLIGYILIKGVPCLKPSLFAWEYNTDNVSMMPAIINTIVMTFVTLLFAVPVGVFSAIYLVEYAKRGNKLGETGSYDDRDTVRYSFYCIWIIWLPDVWCSISLGLFYAERCFDIGYYGSPIHYENHGGSIKSSAGFLSGRKLWSGSRTT